MSPSRCLAHLGPHALRSLLRSAGLGAPGLWPLLDCGLMPQCLCPLLQWFQTFVPRLAWSKLSKRCRHPRMQRPVPLCQPVCVVGRTLCLRLSLKRNLPRFRQTLSNACSSPLLQNGHPACILWHCAQHRHVLWFHVVSWLCSSLSSSMWWLLTSLQPETPPQGLFHPAGLPPGLTPLLPDTPPQGQAHPAVPPPGLAPLRPEAPPQGQTSAGLSSGPTLLQPETPPQGPHPAVLPPGPSLLQPETPPQGLHPAVLPPGLLRTGLLWASSH